MDISHYDSLLTRKSLLQRVKDPDDELAWDEFASYYSGFIGMLLWKMSVPESEHDDLKQEVLLKLWGEMQKFEFDSNRAKFRTWLASVIRNSILHYMRGYRSRERRVVHPEQPDSALSVLGSSEGGLEKLIDDEWANYMIEQVVGHLRQFFSGKAIDVFILSHEEKTAEQISEELEISVDSVYVLRNRVKVRFMQELKQLRSKLEF